MIPELIHVRRRWEETHAAVLDWMARFPDDRWDWSPGGAGTTAGQIVMHIARAESVYAALALGETPVRPAADIRTAEDAAAILEQGRAAAERAFASLSQAELGAVRAVEWRPLGPRVEGPLDSLWFLEQMTRHKAYHLGQLWYLSLLLEPAAER